MSKPRKSSRRLTKAQLRAKYAPERAALVKAKRQGLIAKSANLRKAKPSLALRKKVPLLHTIASGFAQPVKLNVKETRDFKEAGFPVHGKFVILDKKPIEHFRVSKDGRQVILDTVPPEFPDTFVTPFERIVLPVNVRRFDAFYAWIKENPGELERIVGPGNFLAFTFYGNHSTETGDVDWLVDFLQHYKPLFGGEDQNVSASDADKAFRHLVLYKIRPDSMWSNTPRTRRYNPVNATGRNAPRSVNRNKNIYQREYMRDKIRSQTPDERKAYNEKRKLEMRDRRSAQKAKGFKL